MFGQLQLARRVLCSKASYNISYCNSKSKHTDPKGIANRVVITDDGSTIVCWHPKKPFPYEFSRPLPDEVIPEHSVLKVENKSSIYDVFKTKNEEATRQELMKITHTCKHRWFPNNSRYKKIYKKIKSDREWL